MVGNLSILQYLEEYGADIHTDSEKPFRMACRLGQLELVNYLAQSEKGTNVSAKNEEALVWAVKKGYFEIVKVLGEKGADLHTTNEQCL